MANRDRRTAQEFVAEHLLDSPVTFQSRPYTIVEIFAVINDKLYRGIGQAKQGKRDTWHSAMGYEIAYGRAVAQIIKEAKLKC